MLELILPPNQLFFLPHLFLLLLFLFFQQPRQKPGKHLQLPPCYVSDVYLIMPACFSLPFILFFYFGCAGSSLWCGALCCGMLSFSGCSVQASLGVARGLEHTSSVVVALGLSCFAACGMLVPQPGIEPESPALECSLNQWTTREVPTSLLFFLPTHFFFSSQIYHCRAMPRL